MLPFKLLIVEDNQGDLDALYPSIKRYMISNNCQIEYSTCRTFEEACEQINNSFDGAIIDIKLHEDDDGGNKIIEKIREAARIPFAIFTGQPYNANGQGTITKVFTKGPTDHKDILDYLMEIYNTGLTKIFGGRGIIEDSMNRVFWDNIVPNLDSWKLHAINGKETERALVRFTLNHIMELLADHVTPFFEEEMYISPPVTENICTGSILTDSAGTNYLVMTPACDLVIRGNGCFKTDQILVCGIDDFDPIKEQVLDTIPDDKKTKRKMRETLKPLLSNNATAYYHWLPGTDLFKGGILNFRKIKAVKSEEVVKSFGTPTVQISSHFIKDIIRRFSAFYSRQGQPDFNFKEIAKKLIDQID